MNMREVVINACYGGFSLSDAGVRRYAEIKGITLYPEVGKFGMVTYWTLPESERPQELPGEWMSHPVEVRIAHNKACGEAEIYSRDIPRDDPALVQVVKELGAEANGDCAELRIVSIPADVKWRIEEYDGNEHVAEEHQTWA